MSTPKDLVDTPSKRICPASFMNLGSSKPQANENVPALRRWQAIWKALETQLVDSPRSDPHETQFDPVQAAIVTTHIQRAKRHLPPPDLGEIDLDWPQLVFPIDVEELKVFFQFTQQRVDGRLEMYKLKTVQIDEGTEFATSEEEIAVAVADPRYPDSMEAYEIRATDGEMIRLEMSLREAQGILAELENDYRQMANSDPYEIVPGSHCSMCKVADRCDTFPRLDRRTEDIVPFKKRLPSAFQLLISKSRLWELDYCERRAAWRSLYSIPADLDHLSQGASPSMAVGNRFHRRMAKALLSDDPGSFFAGDPEMEGLYLRHLGLPCTADLDIRQTEFPVGFSVRFGTGQHSVSVVLYGLADAVGRESDNTPVIIDHKTGSKGGTSPHETEIYALGALLRIPSAPQVATHVHQLAAGRDPVCERLVWKRDQVGELASRLGSLAETAARWDPLDATSPPFRVGEWCGTCPFEQRCLSFR